MWRITKRYIMPLLLAACCLCSPSVGGCSPSQTYQISETELETLSNHLTMLEQNNETLKRILSESGEELTAALNALTESQKELTMLRSELIQCKSDAQSAKESLERANLELARASESFKASEKERDRIESRLRNQRNIWEFLCAVAVGVAVAK